MPSRSRRHCPRLRCAAPASGGTPGPVRWGPSAPAPSSAGQTAGRSCRGCVWPRGQCGGISPPSRASSVRDERWVLLGWGCGSAPQRNPWAGRWKKSAQVPSEFASSLWPYRRRAPSSPAVPSRQPARYSGSKGERSRRCPSRCCSASSSSASPQPLRGARDALMTQEVFPAPSSSGRSSAPHDFITFYGAAGSSLQAPFGPSFHRSRGSIYTGETARPARPLTHGLFTRCARESYSETCVTRGGARPREPGDPAALRLLRGRLRKATAEPGPAGCCQRGAGHRGDSCCRFPVDAWSVLLLCRRGMKSPVCPRRWPCACPGGFLQDGGAPLPSPLRACTGTAFPHHLPREGVPCLDREAEALSAVGSDPGSSSARLSGSGDPPLRPPHPEPCPGRSGAFPLRSWCAPSRLDAGR